MPAANSATPYATTDVNSEARRNEACMTVAAHGVVLVEFGVGLAAGGLERVVVDDVGLHVGGERAR